MAGLSENPRRNIDGRNLHRSGSDRVDSSHQVSHPRSGTPLPEILRGLFQLHPDFRGFRRTKRHRQAGGGASPDRDDSDCSMQARSTWARLIKKSFEADLLLSPCGGRMRIVSFNTDPRVVDRFCAITKAGDVKSAIRSRQGCRPAYRKKFCNNSKSASEVRLSNRMPVRPECA
jgi:hypothetical protein